jgi:hypothetical protein
VFVVGCGAQRLLTGAAWKQPPVFVLLARTI